MARVSNRLTAGVFVLLLVLSTSSSFLLSDGVRETDATSFNPEWVRFDVRDGVYNDAFGLLDEQLSGENRAPRADATFGTFDDQGLELLRPVSAEFLEPRFDALLLIVSNDMRLHDVRSELSDQPGLAVREFIAPSGLLVQGTPTALSQAGEHPAIITAHAVPIGMFLHEDLMDIVLLEEGETALQGLLLRMDGWRDDAGPLDTVSLSDDTGITLNQHLGAVAGEVFDEWRAWDTGRYEGTLSEVDLPTLLRQPSLMQLRPDPAFSAFNDQSRGHMKTSTMTTYFTTDLDGSGQIVAVADAGLDEDHGDFGTRVVGNYDVIGDGSTADKHSGHGTHVSCTVLGDGFRGGYGGVAQAADLYFQAMENDNTGNFQSPSLNNLLNTAYNAGARTHTNSWGSSAASQQAKYNSETEDVDDRANYYDRYYNGVEGLTILFAAGNDGPNSGTVSPPATAKNVISVGNHKNRYSGSPDVMMSGSSRGPTEDGRIKPDLVAPGGYVRSCRAQEAGDTGSATWTSNYYLEYTGTSMATPNAAGAALMVREYLEEIAQRPSPQGALVKGLLVLGAQDIGSRDIPNDDEGWGRINLRNSLAPPGGQGIWVDDRSVMSGTGNSKSYAFNVSQGNGLFKVVLTWSDERGSRFSTAQLVNDLDLEVTAPDGTVYLGNDFSNGRSATGGTRDSINNLEVVLIDAAATGTWTVKVRDAQHSGSKTQPYALAVLGHGVNDLRPDPKVVPEAFEMNVGIPQVDDPVQLTTSFFNFGNVKADAFPIAFEVNGVEQARTSIELGAGSSKVVMWPWTPAVSGATTLSFIIDPDDAMEEIREDNNRLDVQVNVTAPGVKLETATPILTLQSSEITTTSWNISLTNTALLATNASMQTGQVIHVETGQTMPWYVGSNARTGTIKFHLDNGSDRFTWESTLNVEILPEPTLTFVGLELEDGTTYGTLQGAGSHPSGESLKFTWLLGNDAETVWSPSASLQLDPGLFGECTPVDPVGMGDVSPVVCNVLIAANMAPMSEPSFTLVLNDAGVERTTTVGLLVAPNEQVSWDIDSVPGLTTGQERQVTVEITNTGNTALQRQVMAEAPPKWSVSVDGNDIVDLEVGQSVLVRLNVRADTPGSESITVKLAQSTASEPTFTFAMTSSGEPIGTSGESGLDSSLAVALLFAVLLVAFATLGVSALRGRIEPEKGPHVASLPMPMPAPAPAAQASSPPDEARVQRAPPATLPPAQQKQSNPRATPVETVNITYNIVQNVQDSVIQGNVGLNKEAPMCWTCRQPITTTIVGCPGCGARYHADAAGGCTASSVASCVNCGGPSSAFLKA